MNGTDNTDHATKICHCVDLTEDQLAALIEGSENPTFESVLKTTGAGVKCSACLLDLECFYTERTARPFDKGVTILPTAQSDLDTSEAVSLKQRIYSLIDSVLPTVPRTVHLRMPFLFGEGIDQEIIFSNQGVGYQQQPRTGEHRISIKLRDKNGIVFKKTGFELKAGENRHLSIREIMNGEKLPETDQPFDIGIIELDRKATSPGLYGTTRAHILIKMPSGVASVHMGQPNKTRQHSTRWLYNPSGQRMFLSFVNWWPVPMTVKLTFPLFDDVQNLNLPDPTIETITVPANGAILREIEVPPEFEEALGDVNGRTFVADFDISKGAHCAHMYYTTPDLKCVSIDHLGP